MAVEPKPLDMQGAMIEYSRKGAVINTTWMFWS
jgi:hypothetical protein